MADRPNDRLSDEELWRGVEVTVRDVLLPALTDDWARAVAVQLVGVARYARSRPVDQQAERVAELLAALEQLADNRLVAAHRPRGHSPSAVLRGVGQVLASAVHDDGPSGDEIRGVLRPIVLRHLDEEMADAVPLVNAFRGRLDD